MVELDCARLVFLKVTLNTHSNHLLSYFESIPILIMITVFFRLCHSVV